MGREGQEGWFESLLHVQSEVSLIVCSCPSGSATKGQHFCLLLWLCFTGEMMMFCLVAISVACNNLLTCLVYVCYPSDKVWILLWRKPILVLKSHNFVQCHCFASLHGHCNWDLSTWQLCFPVQAIVTVSHFCARVRSVCELGSERLPAYSPLKPICHPCILYEIINLVSDNTCVSLWSMCYTHLCV